MTDLHCPFRDRACVSDCALFDDGSCCLTGLAALDWLIDINKSLENIDKRLDETARRLASIDDYGIDVIERGKADG